MSTELSRRIAMGAIMIAALSGLLAWDLLGHHHLGVLVLGVIAVVCAAREFRRLAAVHAPAAQLAPVIVVAAVVVAEPQLAYWATRPNHFGEWCAHLQSAPVIALALSLGLLWTVFIQLVRHASEHFTANVGATVFAMVYIGLAFNLLGRIAIDDVHPGNAAAAGRGTLLLIAYIAAVKCGDITAYFGGKAFGRHKMCPRISPGKTWEGFACSFIGALGATLIIQAIAGTERLFAGWWQPVVWGVVLGPLGVLGDLAESALKRDAQVKDSGTSLPGFGGWLDLLDALILAAPVGWLLAHWL